MSRRRGRSPKRWANSSARVCVAARDGCEIDLGRRVRPGDQLLVDVGGRENAPLDGVRHDLLLSSSRSGTYYRRMDEIGVGMLGYAFMGKAHSNAFKKIAYMTWPPPLMPRLVGIAGRNEAGGGTRRRSATATSMRRPTGERARVRRLALVCSTTAARTRCTRRRRLPRREAGEARGSARSRSGRDAAESYEIWRRVAATGVKHLCAFNDRFVPAVRLAREMIDAGELGEIRHFRGRYLQDGADYPSLYTWRFHLDEVGFRSARRPGGCTWSIWRGSSPASPRRSPGS